jgi:hypothetical protein
LAVPQELKAAIHQEESRASMTASLLSPFIPDGHTLTALLVVV